MKKKSILILSARAGAGHVRAAEALVETATALSLPYEIRHEDILRFTLPLFRKIYRDIQYAVVDKSPELWGYLYRKTEFTGTPQPPPQFIKVFNYVNYKKYFKLIETIRPDAIVCTHFLPYAAIAEELEQPAWKIPFFAVTTDYDVHSLWVNPSIKRYYAATKEAAWVLASHGIAESSIAVTGIPVMPAFGLHDSPRAARLAMGYSPKMFTIMILAGGYGAGVIERMLTAVMAVFTPYHRKHFQMLIVCGKNERLFHNLQRIRPPANIHMQLHRQISFIDRLMDCSDVLITKSGGLIVSEALAKQLPMIIYDPVPGQEGRNATYLLEHGAAVSALSLSNLEFKLKQFIDEPQFLVKMKGYASAIAKPDAATEIWNDLLKYI